MKKHLLLLIVLSSSFIVANAQNLVQNPSFETYDTCPNSDGQIKYAIGWSSYASSSDYFNSCSPPYGEGVPYTLVGFQYAHTGIAYAGEYFYAPTSSSAYREDMGTTLLTPLTIGTKYYVTFWVNLCSTDTNYGGNTAVNKEGALFSTVQYSINSPAPTNNFAQVYTNTIISDTLSWTMIQC